MNEWECSHHDCDSTAIGVGGATGLRAIGWEVLLGQAADGGPILLCPVHRTGTIPCKDPKAGELPKLCPLCTALEEAARLQDIITYGVGKTS